MNIHNLFMCKQIHNAIDMIQIHANRFGERKAGRYREGEGENEMHKTISSISIIQTDTNA